MTQLRAIASAMQSVASRANRYHPFDMMEVKIEVFFRLTGIEIVRPLNPAVPVEHQYYTCRLRPFTLEEASAPLFSVAGMRRTFKKVKSWVKRRVFCQDDTFSLYLEVLTGWLTEHALVPEDESGKTILDQRRAPKEAGLLDWLSDANAIGLLVFPFEKIRLSRSRWFPFVKRTFCGPSPLMDGFTWQRFRFAQDYMGFYAESANALLALQKNARKVSPKELLSAVKKVDLARSLFLATIFNAKIDYVEKGTGLVRTDYCYQSNQHTDNAEYFRHFPDDDWQIVLFWWQGQMQWLHAKYPKVFKSQPVKTQAMNPLEIYTRTTATMEKYLSHTAHEVDNEPYTTIIQHLEDMVRTNEENERIRQRNK